MKRPTARGFTLVELLVVIGIIGLVVSLLLPALNKARRAAQTIACLGNLRSLGHAMNLYATQNNGFIPGSGLTSGRHLWKAGTTCMLADPSFDSTTYAPTVNECLDWAGPLARVMGLQDRELLNDFDPITRYRWYLNQPMFRCPSNEGAVMRVGSFGQDLGAQPAFSYVTAVGFLCGPYADHPGAASAGFALNVSYLNDTTNTFPVCPVGYTPKVSKVGSAARKIFMADGARRSYWSNSGTPGTFKQQCYVCEIDPTRTYNQQSIFSDWGAFYSGSCSFHREAVAVNTSQSVPASMDYRPLAYRHGELKPSVNHAGAYRLNAVYFDGHAETLDDLTAANPSLWLPRGAYLAKVQAGTSENDIGGEKVVWVDYYNRFLSALGPSGKYVAD